MDDGVKILATEILADNWGVLTKATLEMRRRDGSWQKVSRESYDHGNAATVLLYNLARQSVVLTRQFRFPLHFSGENPMLIEACAGLLEGDAPADCARKEAEEETGYRVTDVEHVFDAFMSPGSVTEKVSFFLAQYDADSKIGDGGGLEHEGEDIEVIEMAFTDALKMIGSGEITDAKTIMLLQHAALAGVLSRG